MVFISLGQNLLSSKITEKSSTIGNCKKLTENNINNFIFDGKISRTSNQAYPHGKLFPRIIFQSKTDKETSQTHSSTLEKKIIFF